MNRLKRYHLGCGESLRSRHAELLQANRAESIEREKSQTLMLKKSRPGKRH